MVRKLEVGISRLGSATQQSQQGPRLICQLQCAGLCPQVCPHMVSRWQLQHQHHFLPQLHSKTESGGGKLFPWGPPRGCSFKAYCPELDQVTNPKTTTDKGELNYQDWLRFMAPHRDGYVRYQWPLGFFKCMRLS